MALHSYFQGIPVCMVFLLAASAPAFAVPRASTSYSITTDSVSAASGRAVSASYSEDGSMGEVVDVSTASAPALAMKHGFSGQLYEAQSLAITASPAAVAEGLTTQLSAVATMDDGSRILLGGSEARWSVMSGPLVGISSAGLATAGEVFINAQALVQASWQGIGGNLSLAVLNTNVAAPGTSVAVPSVTALAFAATQAGLYQGILKDAGGNVVGAILGLKLLSTRAFTGKVVLNGVTYSLSGSVLADGSYAGQILRAGKSSLAVTLQLGSTSGGGLAMTATVSGDGTLGSGFIAQAPYSKLVPVPTEWVKSYTLLLPTSATGDATKPEGEGYASAKVSALGAISAAGKTGDGAAFSTAGYLSVDGQWQMFQSLYSGKGQLAGVLTFRDVPGVSDVDGTLRWVKNPNAKEARYPLGFALAPSLVGSLYTAPLKGQRVLGALADQAYNSRLTLAGATLPSGGIAKTTTWLASNALTFYGPEKLSATLVPSTGILSGSYADAASKLSVPFAGAVLQKQGLAAGNFVLNNQAGYLLIEPGTSFAYPGSESAGAVARVRLPGSAAAAPVAGAVSFTTAAAGSFGGILSNGASISGGLENVALASNGALSGSMFIEGQRHAFKGSVGADGAATVVILRQGLSSIVGSLHLALETTTVDGFQLTGTFTADGVAHVVEAQRFPVYTALAPAPQAGLYTLAMRAPDVVDATMQPGGDGFASVTLSKLGVASGTLTLADGMTTTLAGKVSRSGEWSVHRSLYGSGFVAGKLTFRTVPSLSDLDGHWRWVKPNAVPRTLSYPAGFDTTRGVVGCRYLPPAKGSRAMASLVDGNFNAWLRLSSPDLSTLPALTLTSVDRAISWDAANKLSYFGPEKVTLSFAATTGLLTGRYEDAVRGVRASFSGALLQGQGLVAGFCLDGSRSGGLVVMPR